MNMFPIKSCAPFRAHVVVNMYEHYETHPPTVIMDFTRLFDDHHYS